jgi:hypothetical protein
VGWCGRVPRTLSASIHPLFVSQQNAARLPQCSAIAEMFQEPSDTALRCPYASEHVDAGADQYRRGTAIPVWGSLYSVHIPALTLDDRLSQSLQTCVCHTCIPWLHIGKLQTPQLHFHHPWILPIYPALLSPANSRIRYTCIRKCDEIPALPMPLQPALSIAYMRFLRDMSTWTLKPSPRLHPSVRCHAFRVPTHSHRTPAHCR